MPHWRDLPHRGEHGLRPGRHLQRLRLLHRWLSVRCDRSAAAPLPGGGGAFKCTFCYDRQIDGLTPACAKACPTESIQFGPLDELHARAEKRVADLQARGFAEAQIYNPVDTSVGGIHAFFLLLGPPEELGLPPRPEVPTVYLRGAWLSAACTSVLALAGACLAFVLM